MRASSEEVRRILLLLLPLLPPPLLPIPLLLLHTGPASGSLGLSLQTGELGLILSGDSLSLSGEQH